MLKKIVDEFFNSAENKEYKKIINLASWIYMIVVPSYLWMFLFEIELFKSLDTIKLLILCVSINSISLFILLIVIYSILEIKYKRKSDNLDNKLFEDATVLLKVLVMIGTVGIFLFKVYSIYNLLFKI